MKKRAIVMMFVLCFHFLALGFAQPDNDAKVKQKEYKISGAMQSMLDFVYTMMRKFDLAG